MFFGPRLFPATPSHAKLLVQLLNTSCSICVDLLYVFFTKLIDDAAAMFLLEHHRFVHLVENKPKQQSTSEMTPNTLRHTSMFFHEKTVLLGSQKSGTQGV